MSKKDKFNRRRVMACAVCAITFSTTIIHAASFTAIVSGDWKDGNTWAVGGTAFPSGANGDTVSLTGDLTVTIVDPQSVQRMNVGTTAASTGNFSVTTTGSLLVGGSISGTSRLVIGAQSTNTSFGSIATGGSINCDSNSTSGAITLGLSDFSKGTLVVGGAITYNPNATTSTGPRIGEKGTGSLTLTTGANVNFAPNTAVLTEIGLNQGAAGIVNVTDGTLSLNAFRIQNVANAANPIAATATMNISGGVVNIATTSSSTGMFSNAAGGQVTLNLSGGTLALKANLSATTTPLTAFNWSGGTIQMVQAVATTVTNSTPINLVSGGTGAIFDAIGTGTGTTNVWSGAISGAGSLTLKSGILTVSSVSNTMTGGITVKGGALLQGANAAFGSPGTTNIITLESGSRLASNSTGSGSSNFPNTIALTGDVGIGSTAASLARVILSGPINLGNATRTLTLNSLGNTSRSLDLSGSINNGTLVVVGAPGSGNLRLISGLTFNNANLTLRSVTANLSANAGLNMTGALFLDTDGILDLGDNAAGSTALRNPTVGSLAGTGFVMNRPIAGVTGTAVLTVNGTQTTTFSGTIFDGTQANVFSGLTVSGGDLTLATPQPYTGPTTVNGGILRLGAAATIASNVITVNPAGTLNPVAAYPAGLPIGAGQTLTYNGTVVGKVLNNGQIITNTAANNTIASDISGIGSISKVTNTATGTAGTTTLTGALTGFTGNVTVEGGRLIAMTPLKPGTGSLVVSGSGASVQLAAPTSPSSATVAGEFASVSVALGDTLSLALTDRATDRARVLISSTLSVVGTLDLSNNDMIVHNGDAAAIRSAVAAWYNGGLFNGVSTIISSAAGTPGQSALATLAVVANVGLGLTSFDGQIVSGTDVLVKYTYLGDTNLDGLVDNTDINNVIAGIRTGGTSWSSGDTNYDGVVNAIDYANALTAYRFQGAPFSDTGPANTGTVPEPACLALFSLALPLALRRRRYHPCNP